MTIPPTLLWSDAESVFEIVVLGGVAVLSKFKLGYEQDEIEYVDDAILNRQSRYLGKLADKYLIPRPKFETTGGAWEQSDISGWWRLNQEALVDLRETIRREQKARRERVQSWLIALTGIIGAVAGLIGVSIGLISVWPN